MVQKKIYGVNITFFMCASIRDIKNMSLIQYRVQIFSFDFSKYKQYNFYFVLFKLIIWSGFEQCNLLKGFIVFSWNSCIICGLENQPNVLIFVCVTRLSSVYAITIGLHATLLKMFATGKGDVKFQFLVHVWLNGL